MGNFSGIGSVSRFPHLIGGVRGTGGVYFDHQGAVLSGYAFMVATEVDGCPFDIGSKLVVALVAAYHLLFHFNRDLDNFALCRILGNFSGVSGVSGFLNLIGGIGSAGGVYFDPQSAVLFGYAFKVVTQVNRCPADIGGKLVVAFVTAHHLQLNGCRKLDNFALCRILGNFSGVCGVSIFLNLVGGVWSAGGVDIDHQSAVLSGYTL